MVLEKRFCKLVVTRKKHMSAAGEECSFGIDTDDNIGCAVAPADSVSKDINDNDDQTVWLRHCPCCPC